MKNKTLRLILIVFIIVLGFSVLFSGCKEETTNQEPVITDKPIASLSSPLPSPGAKGEHYPDNMEFFGDFLNNVYEYECVYQYYKNADIENAFSDAIELKKMLMYSINKDYYLSANEKNEIKQNAENFLNMQFQTLDLECEKNNDSISKELFGITFDQYYMLRLCESMADKCRSTIIDNYLKSEIKIEDAKKYYDANKNDFDFAILRYISYKLSPGGSNSSNQSKTQEAEKLCRKLNTVADMLHIIGGESDRQSEGNSNGQVTVYMNETDSLFYEFLEEGGIAVNSKTVVHDKNNAYVVMCEGYYTWDNSETVKEAVKKACAENYANSLMITSIDLKYNEPEDWYKMSSLDEIKIAKNIDDYSSVISKLKIAKEADTVFLTIQEPGSTTDCKYYAYEKQGDKWQQLFKTDGYVGRTGVADPTNRVEGNGTTPSGVYSFGMLFGINDNPGNLQKSYKKLDNDDYWDGDRYSDTYNQYVKGSEMPSSWNRGASEHLIDYKYSYNYVAMVNFNVNPTIKGKGSAIFLHCTRPGALSSAGCISIPEDKMIKSLRMIDDNAYIVIVKEADDLVKYY